MNDQSLAEGFTCSCKPGSENMTSLQIRVRGFADVYTTVL